MSLSTIVAVCVVLTATDGDTFKVRCPIWPGIIIEDSLRVRGVDTPEKGARAQCDNERRLADLASVEAASLREITITNVGRDKFGRLLADVTVNGADWADTLIRKKLAVPYDGGTKRNPWCK